MTKIVINEPQPAVPEPDTIYVWPILSAETLKKIHDALEERDRRDAVTQEAWNGTRFT